MWKWGTNVDHSMIGGSGEGDRRYHDDSQLFAAPGRDAYVESNFYADDESMVSDAHKAYDGSVDSRSTEGYPYGSTARAHYPWSYQDPLWRPTGERGKPVTPSHDRDAGGSIRKDSDSASWWSRQTSGGKDSVKRMRVVIGVVMATALVVLAGTITAAVLLMQKDEIPVTVHGTVTFNNLTFVDDFRDLSSNASLAFKREFCEGMSDILVPAVGSYDSCDVTDIRAGSVICEYILYYSKPADTSGADVLGEVDRTLAEDFGNNQDGRFKYWLPASEYLGLVPYTTVTPPVATTTAPTERSLTPTPTEPSTTVTVYGIVTFNNLIFVDDFRDHSSNAYLAFKRDFCEGMSDILVPAVGSYDSCDVTDIRNGSVICEYILYYSKSADTSGADVLGEVNKTLTEDFGNNQDGRFKYWVPVSEYLGLVPYTTVTPPVAMTTATTERSLTPTPTEPSTIASTLPSTAPSTLPSTAPSKIPSTTTIAEPSTTPSTTTITEPSTSPSTTTTTEPSTPHLTTIITEPSRTPSTTAIAEPSTPASTTTITEPSTAHSTTTMAEPSTPPSTTTIAEPSTTPAATTFTEPSTTSSTTTITKPSATPSTTATTEPSTTPSTTTFPEPSTPTLTTVITEPSTTPSTTTLTEPSTPPLTTAITEPSTIPSTTTLTEPSTTLLTTTLTEPSASRLTTAIAEASTAPSTTTIAEASTTPSTTTLTEPSTPRLTTAIAELSATPSTKTITEPSTTPSTTTLTEPSTPRLTTAIAEASKAPSTTTIAEASTTPSTTTFTEPSTARLTTAIAEPSATPSTTSITEPSTTPSTSTLTEPSTPRLTTAIAEASTAPSTTTLAEASTTPWTATLTEPSTARLTTAIAEPSATPSTTTITEPSTTPSTTTLTEPSTPRLTTAIAEASTAPSTTTITEPSTTTTVASLTSSPGTVAPTTADTTTPFDPCAIHPCVYGKCVPMGTDYRCDCDPLCKCYNGTTNKNCSIDVVVNKCAGVDGSQYYQNPFDCSGYIWCSAGTPYPFSCGATVVDPSKLPLDPGCTHQEDVACAVYDTPDPTTLDPAVIHETITLDPSVTIDPCPPGRCGNGGECIPNGNDYLCNCTVCECGREYVTKDCTNDIEDKQCKDYPNGYYPHPFDCQKYIRCADGQLYPGDCEPGLVGSSDLGVHCGHSELTTCAHYNATVP